MYISVYMYADVHAYMCVRLANDCVNVKRKQISCFVVRKIPTFYLEAMEATNLKCISFKLSVRARLVSGADPDLQLRGGQIM